MTPDMDAPLGDDPEMTRLLRERLTRYPAPPRLRAAVLRAMEPARERPRWTGWLAPALSALATAMVTIMWLGPALPGGPIDPLQPLIRAVVTEHARTIAWGDAQPEVASTALPRIMDQSGVVLRWVFTGDDEIRLVNAQPTYVEGHRSMALAYEDANGHAVTYLIMPGGSVTLPDRGRAQIDRWRPVVRKDNGFSLIMWKQQGLLCVVVADLVSDDDFARLKEYFVKIRSSTEIAPTS